MNYLRGNTDWNFSQQSLSSSMSVFSMLELHLLSAGFKLTAELVLTGGCDCSLSSLASLDKENFSTKKLITMWLELISCFKCLGKRLLQQA